MVKASTQMQCIVYRCDFVHELNDVQCTEESIAGVTIHNAIGDYQYL